MLASIMPKMPSRFLRNGILRITDATAVGSRGRYCQVGTLRRCLVRPAIVGRLPAKSVATLRKVPGEGRPGFLVPLASEVASAPRLPSGCGLHFSTSRLDRTTSSPSTSAPRPAPRPPRSPRSSPSTALARAGRTMSLSGTGARASSYQCVGTHPSAGRKALLALLDCAHLLYTDCMVDASRGQRHVQGPRHDHNAHRTRRCVAIEAGWAGSGQQT